MASSAPEEFRLRARARMSAHTVWDHMVRPAARKTDDIPWSVEAVTAEWLTPILCGATPGAAVAEVHIDGGSSGSTVRRRIRVTYNEAGQRAGLLDTFFAKSTPSILTRLSSSAAAPQEGKFLRLVRPDLPIEAPTLRYSTFDRKSGRSFQLFEDLTVTRGATFCTYATAIDRSEAEQAVDLLAVLHGRHYASPRLADELRWIPPYEVFYAAMEHNGVETGHDQAKQAAAHLIPADVAAQWDRIWPMAVTGLKAHKDEPRTVIHSDVHLGNWYKTSDRRMGLCDWQCISAGHWARDLAYSIGTLLDVPDRRAWERGLIERYLDALHSEGGPKVGFDHAWLRYRQQTFAALLMWTPTLCHPPTMPDMQPEAMSFEMIRRLTNAIADLDAFGSQPEA
jgi:hypothetical protein